MASFEEQPPDPSGSEKERSTDSKEAFLRNAEDEYLSGVATFAETVAKLKEGGIELSADQEDRLQSKLKDLMRLLDDLKWTERIQSFAAVGAGINGSVTIATFFLAPGIGTAITAGLASSMQLLSSSLSGMAKDLKEDIQKRRAAHVIV